MNQTIEAVKARDRADPFATSYFGDLEMYRRATRHAPPWPYDPYEELNEAMRRAAEPMRPPTPDELDRMAVEWALAGAPVYGRADAAAATTSTT